MKDAFVDVLAHAKGKRILGAWYSNTCSIGDIYAVTLLLEDGSELRIGYGPATPIGKPDCMLVIENMSRECAT